MLACFHNSCERAAIEAANPAHMHVERALLQLEPALDLAASRINVSFAIALVATAHGTHVQALMGADESAAAYFTTPSSMQNAGN